MNQTVDLVVAISAAVGSTAGALIGLGFLIRKLRSALRQLDVVERIVTRELERNSGSSMKDDTLGTAVALEGLSRRLAAVEELLHTHLDNLTERPPA